MVVELFRTSVFCSEAAELLHCRSADIDTFRAEGYLETIGAKKPKETPRGGWVTSKITLSSISSLRAEWDRRAHVVQEPIDIDEFCSFQRMSRAYGWSVARIMTMIFNGTLPLFASGSPEGPQGYFVKRNDADGIFFSNGPAISFAEAAAVMRTGESTIRALTFCADDAGRPLLKFAPLPYLEGSTPPPIFLCEGTFKSFASRHAALGFMATARGTSPADLEMDLVAQGVRPILERGKDHEAVYWRSAC